MPTINIDIHIPSPVLTVGQYFKVRYKLHSSSAWTNDPIHRDNSPWGYGLFDGDFDIGYTVVNADGTECPERIDHFTLHAPVCDCLTSLAGVVEQTTGTTYQLKLTFVLPAVQPACGWIVKLSGSGNPPATFSYQTISSPLIIPIPANSAYIVEVFASCCGNNNVRCGIIDVPGSMAPICIPSVFPKAENQKLILQIGGQFYMQLTCSAQSNPITNSFVIQYQQDQTVVTPNPIDSGTVTVTPTGTAPNILVTFPINPEPNNPSTYHVMVQDICGNFFTVEKL